MKAALAALLLLAGAAGAQFFQIGPTPDSPPEDCLQLTIESVPLATRPGGQGWLEVQVENRGAEAHDLLLDLSTGRAGLSASRSLSLESGARRRLLLPLPASALGCRPLYATVDGDQRQFLDVSLDAEGSVSILVVSDAPAGSGLELQQAAERALAVKDLHTQQVASSALPESWTLLSGADLLLVDGAGRLSPEAQQVLLDAVAAGADLFVGQPELLRSGVGPLCEALRDPGLQAEGSSHHLVSLPRGFGVLWTLAPGATASARYTELLDLPDVSSRIGTTSGFPADTWLQPQKIPDLDEVPTGLFLVLLLGFILFVAWRSLVLLRGRRPLRLLFVLPTSGLAMTAGLLLAGLFSEGIAPRGVRRSLTLLDQRSHRAASICQSTVYAPLGASELVPRPGTLLASMDLLSWYTRDSVPRAWHVDLDQGGRIGGGAVPPRTPTHFSTSSVGLGRERLRFHRVGDELELVADADLRPVPRAGAILLCDFEGRWFVDEGHGRLERVKTLRPDPVLAQSILGAFGAQLEDVEPVTPFTIIRSGMVRSGSSTAQTSADDRLEELITDLPRGAWVALVERSPSVDELELDVHWELETHVVVGLLAPDDIDG